MQIGSKPVHGRPGVVIKNVVSLRKEPHGDTERVTQALIGQHVIAEAGQGEWLFVQTWDTYRGWIPAHAVRMLPVFRDLGSPHLPASSATAVVSDTPGIPDARNPETPTTPYASSGNVAVMRELFVEVLEQPRDGALIITRVPISVELEVAGVRGDWVELRLPDDRGGFIRNHEAKLVNKDVAQTIPLPDPRKLIETAAKFIGTPYLHGGTSPFGIDCSGFMQLVHHIHGVTLLRDSHMQAGDERGVVIEKEKLRTGDMVFFGKESVVTHVGMALDGKRFIHSSGHSGVIISLFTDAHYGPMYWGARRMRLSTMDPGGGAPDR